MTCRALLHARHIAETCNGLECAAPEPVTATRLREARERMALGVIVRVRGHGKYAGWFMIGLPTNDANSPFSETGFWCETPAEATRAYFDLCATLTEPAQASRAATAGADPASTSASLSPSAAPNPSSVCPVAPGAETPSVLGASNPGAR